MDWVGVLLLRMGRGLVSTIILSEILVANTPPSANSVAGLHRSGVSALGTCPFLNLPTAEVTLKLLLAPQHGRRPPPSRERATGPRLGLRSVNRFQCQTPHRASAETGPQRHSGARRTGARANHPGRSPCRSPGPERRRGCRFHVLPG